MSDKAWLKQLNIACGKNVKLTVCDKISLWWEDVFRYGILRDWYINIKNGIFRRYDLIPTKLNRTNWWDKDTLILHGMMELLVDFVDGEKCFEIVSWEEDSHKEAGEEIKAIYAWWKNYPNRQKEIDDVLTAWGDCTFGRKEDLVVPEQTDISKELLKIHDLLENKLLEEEQDMLIRLIKIRKFLWT